VRNLFWLAAEPGRSSPIVATGNDRSASASVSNKLRQCIESAFNRLKGFRRTATRYDRLAQNYLVSVCLAAAQAWRI
jgi:transposase